MKNINLKNKIAFIIILLLAVFSFSNKAFAESPLVCNLYNIDKNTNAVFPVQKYWFLPPGGGYADIIWKGPYDTLDSCNAALNVYKPATIPGASGSVSSDTVYTPLASLPGIGPIDSSQANSFGNYLNLLIKFFIGICAVLAMVMIVIGGIEYMTSELSGHKEEGKERITNAIFGLIIALGAYALLNTINPRLLDVSLSGLTQATVSLDEANFAKTEKPVTAGKDYKLSGTFENPSPSAGVLDFKNNFLDTGYLLVNITVSTSARQAMFLAKKGAVSKYLAVPINIGMNGVSEIGQAKEGDGKTPKGTTAITAHRVLPVKGVAAVTLDGKYNLGAAFIDLGATTTGGKARGIGFHGQADNSLGTTNGCVRMYNDDLVVLAKYMTTGLPVIIQ